MTNNSVLAKSGQKTNAHQWREVVAKYLRPKLSRALWQITNTLLPYAALWVLMYHLSPRIPNYNLEKCHQAEPLFQTVKPVTFFASFKSLTFRLWDEQDRKLVGFRGLKRQLTRPGV